MSKFKPGDVLITTTHGSILKIIEFKEARQKHDEVDYYLIEWIVNKVSPEYNKTQSEVYILPNHVRLVTDQDKINLL